MTADQPHTRVPEISPTKPAQTLQLVQGVYYAAGGLLLALFAGAAVGPTDRTAPTDGLIAVRLVALAAAGFGVALVLSGRREGRGFVPAWAGLWVALALLVQTTAGVAIGTLPGVFLLDSAVEALFFGWWAVTMVARVDREIDRAEAARG